MFFHPDNGEFRHARRDVGELLPTIYILDSFEGRDQGDEVAERCIIVTTDQETGVRKKSDLLETLNKFYRRPKSERFPSGLVSGSYMAVGRECVLRVGDRLMVG